jgi:hypothetical protein
MIEQRDVRQDVPLLQLQEADAGPDTSRTRTGDLLGAIRSVTVHLTKT